MACCSALVSMPVVAVPQSGGNDATASSHGAAAIIERALERAATQRQSARELDFEYINASTIEFLDDDGQVTRTETSRSRRYLLEGHLYSELIERNECPLDDDDARDEREKKARFIREARRHAARGEPYEPEEMSLEFDRELMDRYDTTLAGTEVVRGHTCWVVRFEPRSGRLPDHRRIDKALNRSTGQLWITQDDYAVARVAFEMQRPFRWLWGLAGTLRHATGQFDFQPIEPNLWMPVDSRIEFDVRALFGMKTVRRRMRNAWVEHRPVDSHALLP